MENLVFPSKGESRYIAFDHSPPCIFLFVQEVSTLVMLPNVSDFSPKMII